jgi:predicted MFS family arabinose efflux permease
VFSTQLLLRLVPAEVRGRVFATEFALLTLAMATSAALGGWALDRSALGIGELLHGMAGAVLFPGLLWGFWTFRSRSTKL